MATSKVRWQFKVSAWSLVAIAILLIWLIRPFSCDSQPSKPDGSITHRIREKWRTMTVSDTITVIDTIYTAVEASGYWVPDTVYTPADTLPVEVVVITNTDTVFVAVTIDSTLVAIDTLTFVPLVIPERRWQVFAEYNDTQTMTVGVGYRVCEWKGIQVSPSIGSNGEYAFAEIRLHRYVWSGVSCGVGVGYRILAEEGLHYSAGISIEL